MMMRWELRCKLVGANLKAPPGLIMKVLIVKVLIMKRMNSAFTLCFQLETPLLCLLSVGAIRRRRRRATTMRRRSSAR